MFGFSLLKQVWSEVRTSTLRLESSPISADAIHVSTMFGVISKPELSLNRV